MLHTASRATGSGERALVPYDATNGLHSSAYTAADATKLKRAHATPNELILHESICGLIAEVAELRQRYEHLEATNSVLTESMRSLEQAYCNDVIRAPLTKGNLTGYASSDSGCTTSSGAENGVDEKFAAVGEILEHYNRRLQDQATYQQKQEACISELAKYRQSSEALFNALKNEFEGLSVAENCHNTEIGFLSGSNEVVGHFVDKHERLEGRFNTFELQHDEMQASVHDIKGRLDTMAEAIQAGAHLSHAAPTVDTTGKASSVYGKSEFEKHVLGQLQLVQERQDKLKAFQREVARKFRQEQIIDDAPTKESLYGMFRDIEKILDTDGQRRRSGQFEGTFDELMPLRDRIIYRLTLFNAYGVTLEQARKAAKDVD